MADGGLHKVGLVVLRFFVGPLSSLVVCSSLRKKRNRWPTSGGASKPPAKWKCNVTAGRIADRLTRVADLIKQQQEELKAMRHVCLLAWQKTFLSVACRRAKAVQSRWHCCQSLRSSCALAQSCGVDRRPSASAPVCHSQHYFFRQYLLVGR